MAEEENKEETQEESAPKKKSNLLLIIIIVVLLLIIVLFAGIFLMMGGDEEDATQQTIKQEQPHKSMKKKKSTYTEEDRSLSDIGILYPLDTFTVNLKSDSGRRFLKCTISLELEGEELSMELDSKSAVLRDRIIRILTSKTLEEVSSKKGKAKLTQQIIDALNAMITDGRIKGLYFTEFVIQ